MSRGDGFPVADVDSSYFDDAKMRALWQRLRDVDLMARAVCLHKSTLLASWRHGERLTVEEAAPIWLPVDLALVGHLQAVRLLDKHGRVSSASWSAWFGAAEERRDLAREKGRRGGLAKARNRASRATAQVEPSSSPALPVPSVPTVPTVPSELDPHTPTSGGRRSNGTNPRALAAEITRRANEAEAERKRRRNERHLAYLNGQITAAQRDEMNDRDAPLEEIPPQRGAAFMGAVS